MDSRQIIKTNIARCLDMNAAAKKLSAADRLLLAAAIERGCFNTTIIQSIKDGIERLWSEPKFVSRYSLICSRVLNNIDPTSSANFHVSGPDTYAMSLVICDGAPNLAAAEKLATMSSQELNPISSEEETRMIEIRMLSKIDVKSSSLYKCPKCKKSKSTSSEFVGKGIDEGTCRAYECLECGHIWH